MEHCVETPDVRLPAPPLAARVSEQTGVPADAARAARAKSGPRVPFATTAVED